MYMSYIALNTKRLIQSKGLKQKRVAEKAGYNPKKFSDMLNGRKLITADDVLPIAEALEVSANDLLKRPNDIVIKSED